MIYKKTKNGFEFYIGKVSIGNDFSIDIQKEGMTEDEAKTFADHVIAALELDSN